MPKATITVGVSASGKTTWAKEQSAVDVNRDWIRFNIVCPGSDWGNYKFTKARENEVTKIQEQMVMDAYGKDQDVIISDTNLNPKILNKWKSFLADLGYTVEIKEFPVSLEEAWKRDTLRANGVGRDVIYTQYQKWLEYKDRKTYVADESKPKAVIFDIDGTLACMECDYCRNKRLGIAN
jgi:predicted kinase